MTGEFPIAQATPEALMQRMTQEKEADHVLAQ